jgi:hypothetical protein
LQGGSVTHEDFTRQEEIKLSSDRNFGLVIATVFLVVSFCPLFTPNRSAGGH